MTFSAALTDFRAQFHAADPEPKDDGLRQVPYAPLAADERDRMASWKRRYQSRNGITPTDYRIPVEDSPCPQS